MTQAPLNPDLKVGIIIPTRNRSEFVIRQLKYYASVNCRHTIYIGDSSDPEHVQKLENEIKKINGSLNINHWICPELNSYSTVFMSKKIQGLLSRVKEKYTTLSGDDDYQIPTSLSLCAEFLENNLDYSSASGYGVSFRLKNSGAYGEIKRLADFPRRQIETNTASERLVSFMSKYYVPLFSVHRTEESRKCWSQATELDDWDFGTEILPCAMSLVLGKSKIIDCLGFIRQIHDQRHKPPDIFDWIAGKDWRSSYEVMSNILSGELVVKDKINIDDAKRSVKQSLWAYIINQGSRIYDSQFSTQDTESKIFKINLLSKLRFDIGQNFPWLKIIYRRAIRPLTATPLQLHYEVLQKYSKYHKDFKPVMDSFNGKTGIN